MGECNLCISNTEFKSKKALTKHRRIKHTAKRADIQMWCCSFCHGLFKGYPRDRHFYLHQQQGCYSAPPFPANLQTATIEDLLEIPGIGNGKIERLVEKRIEQNLTLQILLTPKSLGGVGISSKVYEKWSKHGWAKSLHINGRSLHDYWRNCSKNGTNLKKAAKRKYYCLK